MGRKPSTLLRERLKVLAKERQHMPNQQPEELTDKERIQELESHIRLCEADLKMLPNNI